MINYEIYYGVIFFFLYSVIGYICETTYCSIPAKHFINRGFLHGPYIPVYGFGGLIILKVLNSFYSTPILVFLGGLILTSILEYFTSWILEISFNTKLWDYSKKILNINGRVCLKNSFLFGIMGLGLTYIINPFLSSIVFNFPKESIPLIALIISIIISFDFAISISRMAAFRRQIEMFNHKRHDIEAQLKAITLDISVKSFFEMQLEEQSEKLKSMAKHYLRSFPTMTSSNKERSQIIEKLKLNFQENLKKRIKK